MSGPVRILGVSCFFHDAAACLLEDGRLTAAAQEERFTRVKHDPGFPEHAINYCLEEARIDGADIDHIVYYEMPTLALDRVAAQLSGLPEDVAWTHFRAMAPAWRSQKLNFEGWVERALPDFQGQIHQVLHHHAHVAAAFYPSPFDDAAILSIDGVGEWSTATVAHGKGNQIAPMREMNFPNSVGLLYSAATNYLGFKVNSGEYKVMGLAPYGEPIFADVIKEHIVTCHADGSIKLAPEYFDFSGAGPIATHCWAKLLGVPRRKPESDLGKQHMDIAASIQSVTEEIMIAMARHAREITGSRNLCMAGGVALNCVGNGKILRENIFDDIWVQPASGDAGNAVGAAFALWHEKLGQERQAQKPDSMKHCRLGPAYDESEIIDFLELYGFPYEVLDDKALPERIAEILERGEIIGCMQGGMEFGPRALGARSIIGDPRRPEMQQRMNLKIKFRESFRPFAPIVLAEKAEEWFDLDAPSPYMLLVAPVKEDKRLPIDDDIPDADIKMQLLQPRSQVAAITHVDYSARVQTITPESAPRLHDILQCFENRTDVPVLINTSFNLRGEPIVCSPMDAYRCMMRSNIDNLLMERILVRRVDQPAWQEQGEWQDDFALD